MQRRLKHREAKCVSQAQTAGKRQNQSLNLNHLALRIHALLPFILRLDDSPVLIASLVSSHRNPLYPLGTILQLKPALSCLQVCFCSCCFLLECPFLLLLPVKICSLFCKLQLRWHSLSNLYTQFSITHFLFFPCIAHFEKNNLITSATAWCVCSPCPENGNWIYLFQCC